MYQNYYKLNFEYSIDIIKFWLFYPVTAHEYSGFEIFFMSSCPLGNRKTWFGCPSQPLSSSKSKKIKHWGSSSLLTVLFHNKMPLTYVSCVFFLSLKAKTVVACLASTCRFIFWKPSVITTKHSIFFCNKL